MNRLTLGSLFSGSGGFELAGLLAGVVPLWNSEIEPYPIRVTKKNLPFVKHYGDVRKLDGRILEPVDIITFGSPCQNLSIAGNREGLCGDRSSLFHEAIRIVREMREKTNGEKPRFIVWENVCGAFSSNKGEDFRAILEEICRVKDSTISIPKADKWTRSGEIMGEGFSLAWRTFNAQYWGVPQRRRRIYLVADFRGECASKILFESEGLSGYSRASKTSWKASTRDIRTSTNNTSTKLKAYENHSQDTRYTPLDDVAPTVLSTYGTGGNNQPFVVQCYDVRLSYKNTKTSPRANVYETDTSRTLDITVPTPEKNQGGLAVVYYSTSKNSHHTQVTENLIASLVASDYRDPPTVSDKGFVRRITPTECARLQGFPDFWCEGLGIKKPTDDDVQWWREIFNERALINGSRPYSDKQIRSWLEKDSFDSAEYKMWGNGICLYNALFVLCGIAYYS